MNLICDSCLGNYIRPDTLQTCLQTCIFDSTTVCPKKLIFTQYIPVFFDEKITSVYKQQQQQQFVNL